MFCPKDGHFYNSLCMASKPGLCSFFDKDHLYSVVVINNLQQVVNRTHFFSPSQQGKVFQANIGIPLVTNKLFF